MQYAKKKKTNKHKQRLLSYRSQVKSIRQEILVVDSIELYSVTEFQ